METAARRGDFMRTGSLMPRSRIARRSNHPELHFPFFGNHVLVPGGIPDEFNAGIIDPFNGHDFRLGIGGNDGTHAATGSGERHFDADDGLTVFFGDRAIVNQTEVDDIDWNLRVVDALELGPDLILDGGILEGFGRSDLFFLRFEIDAHGIRILRGNPSEACGSGDREGAAQPLGDVNRSAGGKGDGVAAGDLDGVDFALERDFLLHGATLGSRSPGASGLRKGGFQACCGG